MTDLYGNTSGLSPLARRTLTRIYRRRIPADRIATPELVRSLAEASRETKRQVGALVHRSGQVDYVIVGTATTLMLPDIGRLRAAQGRFRALRLVHTHLFGEPLTQDDLVDLTRLKLDLVYAILLSPTGEPRSVTWAHNVPRALPDPSVVEHDRLSYTVSPPIPYGRSEPNFSELIGSLEAEFSRQTRTRRVSSQRAILIHVGGKRGSGAAAKAKASVKELESLARTAGVEVVEQVVQLRDAIDPRFVLGKGRLEHVLMQAIDLDANVLIFDQELSPAQTSAIATTTDLSVIDRSQLILDIFAQHAETRDGKLQVELAQLQYRLPRLGLRDDALSRLTGGIGGRGPGETKLEIGRRRTRERITHLEQQLKTSARKRGEQRKQRARRGAKLVALVGYTNAGKSTLLNALTGSDVLAEDKLFATLDTRARQLYLPQSGPAIIADTVGFIRDMPKALFAAFRATFEEAGEAQLLLEIVDASSPEVAEHLEATQQLLERLELDNISRLVVYNKIDRVRECDQLPELPDDAIAVSALDPHSVRELLLAIDQRLAALRIRDSATSPHPYELEPA